MDPVAKKKPRPRRSFTPELKAEIVELCRRGDRLLGQVARDFDLTETAVREWVKQADLDAGSRSDGLTSDERAELAALRRENCRLRDVEVLKRRRRSSPGRSGERVSVHRGGEAQLLERIRHHHARSKGRDGASRIHADLLDEGRR